MNNFFILILSFIFLSSSAYSQGSEINDIWRYTQLYKNEQGNYFNLSGRLQADATYFNSTSNNLASNEDNTYSDIIWRRFRFGFKAKYGHIHTALEGDFDLNDGGKYKRLTDANLSWNLDNGIKLTVLKHSTGFTLDGRTSSKKLLTPQRNNLTNNLWFTAEYFTGVSIKGKLTNQTSYTSGIFSSDGSDEIGFTKGSYFALFSLTSSFSKNQLWDKAEVGFDYVYNDVDEQGNTRDFSNVASFSTKLNTGSWHLWSDLSLGQGELGQSDLWGLVIMPFFQQTNKIQWLMRYTYLDSEQVNGLRLGKYEHKIIEDKGNNYQEIYAGVNYLINSHKLKLHFGGQYTQMLDDADDGGKYGGWGITLALRSYW
ncbi:MAG: OprO/OprP family phosphate-selective porin [Colwellia sp.]|nr:OprO/OprP family phosphate-selective porin [Colwellia sp.]